MITIIFWFLNKYYRQSNTSKQYLFTTLSMKDAKFSIIKGQDHGHGHCHMTFGHKKPVMITYH